MNEHTEQKFGNLPMSAKFVRGLDKSDPPVYLWKATSTRAADAKGNIFTIGQHELVYWIKVKPKEY